MGTQLYKVVAHLATKLPHHKVQQTEKKSTYAPRLENKRKAVILEHRQMSLHWDWRCHMPTQDERLAILEQTVTALRADFLHAIIENTRSMSTINKTVLQQEQNARDTNHEITILTGMMLSQGKDIKDIKNRVSDFDQRFTSLEDHFTSFEESVTKRFETQEKKLDQILLLLVAKSD